MNIGSKNKKIWVFGERKIEKEKLGKQNNILKIVSLNSIFCFITVPTLHLASNWLANYISPLWRGGICSKSQTPPPTTDVWNYKEY